jgi:integrative and conjugative element protein (TIGR02256 family)
VTRPAVRIASGALTDMQTALRAALPRETGGILLGWRSSPNIVVVDALHVPDPDAAETQYLRRHGVATDALDQYLATSHNPDIGYVGEWHTHPMPSDPSITDKNSIAAAATSTDAPIAIIVLAWNSATSESTIHAAIVRTHVNHVVLTPAPCMPIEGADPDNSIE